jgi:hypothetical protein
MRTSILSVLLLAMLALAQAGSIRVVSTQTKPRFELCSICVSFMDQALSQLMNIIANGGVIGGCADVCAFLVNPVEVGVCNLVCDAFGIEEFVKLVEMVDPEPIFICEEVKMCSVNDNARGNISSIVAAPKSSPVGSTVTINVVYTVVNTIGTGQIVLEIIPPQGDILEADNLLVNAAPGQYSFTAQLDTSSQDTPFVPGTYQIVAGLCEGQCGSSHAHSYLLSEAKGSFTLTN